MLLAIKSIVLGIVQGLTEFLPISSTGHMIILDEYLKLPQGFRETFLVVVQLGSIFSVLVYFRGRIFPKGLFASRSSIRGYFWMWAKVLAGVLPAILIGGLFGSAIKAKLYSTMTVAIALALGGVLLLVIEGRKRIGKFGAIETLPWSRCLGVGLAQCVAMIPGVSRSAATIVGAMLLGCSRELAVEYSFFLAIPTMFAASAYSLMKEGANLSANEWIATACGFVTAFLVAWAVIALFMSYIRKKNLKVFGWYRIVLAVVLLIWLQCLK